MTVQLSRILTKLYEGRKLSPKELGALSKARADGSLMALLLETPRATREMAITLAARQTPETREKIDERIIRENPSLRTTITRMTKGLYTPLRGGIMARSVGSDTSPIPEDVIIKLNQVPQNICEYNEGEPAGRGGGDQGLTRAIDWAQLTQILDGV